MGSQVLRGCEDEELQNLHLQRNPAVYNFTRQGAGLNVSGGRAPRVLSGTAGPRCNRHSLGGLGGSTWPWSAEPLVLQALESDERSHYLAVMEAMRVIGFSAEEVRSVRRVLAAILHLVSLAGAVGPWPLERETELRGPSWPIPPSGRLNAWRGSWRPGLELGALQTCPASLVGGPAGWTLAPQAAEPPLPARRPEGRECLVAAGSGPRT